MDTLPETNVDPSNGWLEYYFPFGEVYFQGLCHVCFRQGILKRMRIVVTVHPIRGWIFLGLFARILQV